MRQLLAGFFSGQLVTVVGSKLSESLAESMIDGRAAADADRRASRAPREAQDFTSDEFGPACMQRTHTHDPVLP